MVGTTPTGATPIVVGASPAGATPIVVGTNVFVVTVVPETSKTPDRFVRGTDVNPTPLKSRARMATGISEVTVRRPTTLSSGRLTKSSFTNCESWFPAAIV